MTEILVISHGNLAKEMVKIAEVILEKPIKATPICFDLDHEPAEYTRKITDIMDSLKPEHQVIILTDLFGGTPSNVTIPFIQENKLEVITGLNLSMLLYLLSQPESKSFKELCEGAKKAGQEAIIIAGEFLS
ncbi:MAG: hypothetical protein GY866_25965 [Proteobacteria bacterium]|nr:hypothetical protein [Pseudomonadota bacterium]